MRQFQISNFRFLFLLFPSLLHAATGTHAMVATIHPIATDAAIAVLHNGGNAIDAAIEAALTLGVVDSHDSGIGGGCFMLIRLADGRTFALDGRETAPARATRDMFLKDGKADPNLSQTGALASGVPGALAVYAYAAEHFGHKSLADLLRPAADVAEAGFPIDASYAKKLKATVAELSQFPESKRILLHPDGSPLASGETLKQSDLAHTYRAIADHGTDYFYKGEFAKSVSDWMASNHGILSAEDFANYSIQLRGPLVSSYRGYTIVGFPPPSSGGVHVAQILNILSHFDLAALQSKNPASRVHVISEAMSLAFADRAFFLGDPDFVPVPKGLLDPTYASTLASQISMDHASTFNHGFPPDDGSFETKKHTTHIAVADADGNIVALTATINTSFGSKVIVPGTGVLLNDEMDDFSAQPGVPNHFHLVGSEANAVAPHKRPLSSMSPTIVLKENKPVLTAGAAGGPKIITQVVLAITNVLDLHDDAKQALARPRFHHQWSPNEIWIEKTTDPSILSALQEQGHKLDIVDPAGASQLIVIDPQTGAFDGATEPRALGKADGF